MLFKGYMSTSPTVHT